MHTVHVCPRVESLCYCLLTPVCRTRNVRIRSNIDVIMLTYILLEFMREKYKYIEFYMKLQGDTYSIIKKKRLYVQKKN